MQKLKYQHVKYFLMSAFVAELDKSTSTLISQPNGSYDVGIYWSIFYTREIIFVSLSPFYQSSY